MNSNYAIVLIKPDAIRDTLDTMIIQDLKDGTSIDIVFLKYQRITETMARYIYPTWITRYEFPSMVYNITQGSSLFIIVKGNEYIYESLRTVKGKMNEGGLRLKYRTRSIEDWQRLGYSGRELQNKIAENRLHTTDNFQETVFLCALILESRDIAILGSLVPNLAIAIRDSLAIQKWAAPQ